MAQEKVAGVVLDIGMEGMDGFEVISAMKADPALAGVPIVVETSEHAHEEASLLAGADDFIVKPFNPVVVRKRVENIVIKHVLERERLQMEVQKNELLASRRASELLFAAEHDSLTGLYNRSAFFRKTAAYLAERPSEDYTVVQFDIERFKVINELYGSEKGDEVLLAIAGALRESVQDIGTYGRMEADRFAMCLPRAYATEKAFEQPLAAALERTGLDRQIVLCYGMYEVVDRSMPVDIMCDRANLALRSGKRCYVDKTFAPDHFAAKRMLDLAEQSGTPCWSSSALRFAEEYQAADKTNIKGVNAWGPNGFEDYAIHQLEPIFMMMQAPATEVMHLTNDEVYTGVLRFADGRTATLSGYAKGSPFMMNIARSTENSVLEICSDYFRHFIEALVEFFKNGTIPAPHSETLSIISAWGALMEAEKTPGIWVKVPKD